MQIGLDLVEISRIAKLLEKPQFLARFFSKKELAEFKAHDYKPESIAGAFAAKEAFAKCMGTGISGFNLADISLLHNHLGAPYIELTGNAKTLTNDKNLTFSVSISHTKDTAAAVVIATKKP